MEAVDLWGVLAQPLPEGRRQSQRHDEPKAHNAPHHTTNLRFTGRASRMTNLRLTTRHTTPQT